MKEVKVKPNIWIKIWGEVLILPHPIAQRMYESSWIVPVDLKVPGGEVKLTPKGEDMLKQGFKLV